MEEVKLEEEQENSAVQELKEDPDCGDDLSLGEASPSLVQIKEELEEQMILQESIFAFPVIVSVRSEKEESLLPETFKEENIEDRDGENSSDTDDSGDWTPSAESLTPQTHTAKQERPFSCSVCARKFTRKYYLQLHMRTHQNHRPFSCSICVKDFTRKCYLQLHLKTHRGQRLYQNKHEDQDKGHRKKKRKESSLHLTVTEENREDRDGAGLDKHSENPFDDSGNCTSSAERTSQDESGLTYVNDPTKDETRGKVTSLKCSQCGKQFQRLGMFKRHMRTHQTERPFSCSVCERAFTQKCYLQLHLKTHGEQKVKKFSLYPTEKKKNRDDRDGAEVGLEEHSDTDHSGDWIPTPETQTEEQLQLFSCTVCARKFTRKYYLQLHSKAHQKDRAFSCAVCAKDFTQKCYLQLNLKTHGEQRLYQNKHSETSPDTDNSGDWTASAESPTPETQTERQLQLFSCTVCARKFTRKYYLQLHSNAHQKERAFSCDVCAKLFKRKCYLQLHLKTHREPRLYKTKQKNQDNGDDDKKVKKSSLHQTGKKKNSEGRDGAGLEKHSENSSDNSGNCTPSAERTSQDESGLVHVRDLTTDVARGKVTPLKCSQCGKLFQRLGMFKRHMTKHKLEHPFSCPVCSKPFIRKCYLQLHLKTHREQRLYQDKGGKNKKRKLSSLHQQVKNIDNRTGADSGLEGCSTEDCGDRISSAESPIPEMHTEKRQRPFSCTVCARKFTRKYYLRLHSKAHPKDGPFSCTVCAKDFKRKCYLQLHLKTHRGQRLYQTKHKKQSKGCESKIKKENGEDRDGAGSEEHSENSSDDDDSGDWPFLKCGQCGKEFPTIKRLRSHEKNHLPEKPFKCSFCKMSFRTNSRQQEHMRTHTGEKPFRCPVCTKEFTSEKLQKLHMRVHTGERPFRCPVCSRTYTQGQSLKQHMLTHTGEKPFKCSMCEKAFYEKKSLKLHKRIHTGERPYKCSVCGMAFTLNGHLTRHMVRIHTRERPFKCTVCLKAFSLKYSLKTHMKIHADERPYKCSVCAATFKQSAPYRQHMRSHRGARFSCSLCSKTYVRKCHLKKHLKWHNEFKCSIGGKKKCLKYHVNMAGERPFRCMICLKDFAAAGWFKKHMQAHSGEKS